MAEQIKIKKKSKISLVEEKSAAGERWWWLVVDGVTRDIWPYDEYDQARATTLVLVAHREHLRTKEKRKRAKSLALDDARRERKRLYDKARRTKPEETPEETPEEGTK